MTDTKLEHKGFTGHVTFDTRDDIFCGSAKNAQGDTVLFEGETEAAAVKDFREGVEDMIEWNEADA